jgi:multiple sugar transport system permease protein
VTLRRALLWGAVAATVLFCLFPFYWLINTSLKTGADLSNANLLPPSPTLDNYTSIFEDDAFTKAIRNSAIIAGSVTLVSLLIGSFAGYALARIHLPFKFLILAILLSISTFPPIAIAAPIFDIWTDIGLYNTYLGLILPSLAFGLPLTVYILASFFRDIPRELEEAAMIDGATRFQAFRKIVVPLGAPGVVTAGLLVFIFAWNEFLFANTFLFDAKHWPVTVVIPNFATQHTIDYGAQAAAAIAVTVPLAALVLVFQRRIVSGLTAGAVKG